MNIWWKHLRLAWYEWNVKFNKEQIVTLKEDIKITQKKIDEINDNN